MNIYKHIFNFGEDFYKFTGLNIFLPIMFFFPNFAPRLFGKAIGAKGKKIKK